jgi:hypothetical protein
LIWRLETPKISNPAQGRTSEYHKRDLAVAGPDFPPLLAPGRHVMSLPELRALCVTNFALSTSREQLMRSVEALCTAVSTALISSEIWVDGSFLTQKMDPADVDLVVVVQSTSWPGTGQQRHILNRVARKNFGSPPCDSYVLVEYPAGSPHFSVSEIMRAYWIKQFCFNRNEEMKGLAVLRTPIA